MDIQPNAQGKKFNLTPLSPKDFELAPVTAEAFMPENLGGITPEQPGIEVPEPEEPQKRQGYFQGLGQSLKVSLNNLTEMPLQLPQATEALGNMVFDRFSEGVINRGVKRGEIDPKTAVILKGNKDLFTPKASLGLPALPGTQSLGENISESKLTKWFEDNQEELKSTITRYDKTATEYLKNKQFVKALGAISYGVAESFAPTIAAAFTPYGAVTLGVGTAALKYDEVKDRDDMAEGMKVADAVTTGIFEWLFEKYGTIEMTKWLRGVYSKAGAEGLQKAINSGPVINLLSQAYKKFGVWFAPVHEGLSEGLTTIGQNLASQFSGEDPDLDWKDNVVDSFLIGTGMGGAFGGTAALAKKRVEVNSERFARKDKLAIDTFGEDKINELADLMRVGDNEGISAFSYSLEIPEGDGRGKMVSSLWSLARRRASQPLTIPEDPDAPIKASIDEYGAILKYNNNIPLGQDPNPLIRLAKHKTEIINPDPKAPDYFIVQAGEMEGDPMLAAYDYIKLKESGFKRGPDGKFEVRPVMLKENQLRDILDIPYQQWQTDEVNQFKQAQVQGQQMVIKAQAPVQEGQEITLKDKRFVVNAVDETGVTLNEMDKDENMTGKTLLVPPEDYEKVFGVPAVDPNVSNVSDPVETSETSAVGAENALTEPAPLPVNKKGEIEYDQITEPEIYAQGLTQEFGEEAPAILDELIAEQLAALEKAKKGSNAIERARKVKAINAELKKLSGVKEILTPTTIAEGPSLEAPSASPVVEQPEPIEQATEQELARPDFEKPQKYTLNLKNKDLPQAPKISTDDIDWIESGLEDGLSEETFGEIKSIKLLETRGRNMNGRLVGTVRVVGTEVAETFEVFFNENKEELARPEEEQVIAQTPSTPDETAPVEAEMQKAGEVDAPEVQEKAEPEEQPGKRQPLSAFKPGDIVRNVTGDVWEVVEIPADIEQRAILRDPNDGSTVEWSQKIASWILQKKEESPEVQLIKANAEVDTRPTEAQKEAGNYQKGHLKLHGLDISIENPVGSIRKGTDKKGNEWAIVLNNSYGYIRRTVSPEGNDQVDVFLGDNLDSDSVYVIDQIDPDSGKFDEHKVMIGFNSAQDAKDNYLANYEPGWKGLGDITKMAIEDFKQWVFDKEATQKPLSYKEAVDGAEKIVAGFNEDVRKLWNIGKAKDFVILPAENLVYKPEGRSGYCETNTYNKVKSDPERYFPVGGYMIQHESTLVEHWWVYDKVEGRHIEVTPMGSDRGDWLTGYFGIISYDVNDEIVNSENFYDGPQFLKGGHIYHTYLKEDKNPPKIEPSTPHEAPAEAPKQQTAPEGAGEKAEFAGEVLDNAPKTRSLREFAKGDHVKNIKTGNEYVVISVPKTGDVSLKKLKGKEIQNFNGKSPQWIPIQREIKAKGAKRTVKFGPDSQKGKLLARMPQTFKEYVLQFFVRGGRVSHADFFRHVGWKAGKKEGFIWAVKGAAVDPEGKTEQGKAFDSFWEDVPEEWGRRGGMEDTIEIVDILKTYPSITQMMDELKRLQSQDESVPDRNIPSQEELGAAMSDADIEDDLSNHEDEIVGTYDDMWDNPDYQIIFDKYSTDKGLDVDKLLADINDNPGEISTLTPFGLNDKELNTLKKYLEDEQSRRKESQGTESIQGLDQDKGQSGEKDSSGSGQGDTVRTGSKEGEGSEVGSPGREFKYKMNARPFDIGTYPKDGFVKAEDDPRGGFQILTYNRKLTEKERNHWSFLPLTEIDDLEGKQFEDQDGEYFVDLEWMPNYSGADVSMFDSKNQLVEKPYFMSTNDILKNIESGYWVEKKKAEKSKETPKDDIDKINDILDKPVESTKGPSYSPIQQKQIDKINKEYSEQIAKKEAAIVQAEKDMREALLKADNRNGLFGDTNPVKKDEIIKRDEQGFSYSEATRAAVRKPFEEKMAELRKEIEELKLEQKGKIESVIKQQDLFADTPAEPADSKPIDKESLPKHEDFGQKIGGARKDMDITRKVRDTDSLPAWRRKYHYARADGLMVIGEPVDTSKPFIVQWSKEIASWGGKRTIYRPVTTIDTRETKIFNSEEEAEAYIPIYEVWKQNFRVRKSGDNYVITKTSSTNKVVEYATFPTEEEANTYMYSTEGATSLLNHKREDFSIPALDKVERTGKDWRKGKDISTEEFMETFGFRGGEFGNWVKPEERRVMLNAAYDSFMDLAELLGVPPRSLSLSGELSIAFGARGVKGAAAHFEPDRAVINLTRMNGAGSLAHEWAHALDNYFGLQAAKKDYSRNDKGEVKAGRVMRTEAGLLAIQGMRKALSEKFDKIIEATQEKSVTRKMGIDEKQLAFDKFQKSVKREADDLIKKFTNGVRRYQYNRKTKQREDVVIKATPDQIKKAKNIVDKIIAGEGTKPTWERIPGSKGMGKYSYISPETLALEELHKAVFGKTGLDRDGNGFYNLGYYSDRMYRAKETLDKALAGESETLNVPTDFLKVSREFDKSRATPYWSSRIEMFARAFEYFIETKLQDQNVRADYLQYDKAPVYDAVYGKNPYPQGEERAEINKLFQQFFDEVKVKTDENDVSLLYENEEDYVRDQLDGYENEAQRQKAIDNAISRTQGRNLDSGLRATNPLYPKVLPRTVLKGFKESGYVDVIGQKINSPQDLADLWSIHRSPYIEKAHIIFVKDGKIVGSTASAVNNIGHALIPLPEEVVELYHKFGADGVYYLHNHPSGNNKPSVGDIMVTKNHGIFLAERGLNLLGHVVVDTKKFSFIDVKSNPPKDFQYKDEVDDYINEYVREYEYKNPVPRLFSERETLKDTGQERLIEISKALLTENGYKGAIIYLSSNLEISAYDVFPEGATVKDIVRIAQDGLNNHLGSQVAFVHDGSYRYEFELASPLQTNVLDVIDTKRMTGEWFSKEKRETYDVRQILWEGQSEYKPEFAGEYLERSQDITKTPAFKKWFGNSKVVDENGKPLVVYHGTNADFNEFNKDKIGTNSGNFGFIGKGFYFTPDQGIASAYGKLMPVYLSLQNPFDLTKPLSKKDAEILNDVSETGAFEEGNTPDDVYNGFSYSIPEYPEIAEAISNGLKAFGYDGVILKGRDKNEIVVFSPTQIKSTGNKGTFDPENPNILEEPQDNYRFAGDWLEEQPEVGPNPELLKSAAQIYAERQAKGNISETVQGIREYIQDMNLPVRKFEEDVLKRGGQQDNNSKPYRDMNLSFGRQEKLYTDYFDKKMKPIFKAIAAIKKAGVKGEEILPYVIAKHAIERNPIMRGEALRAWVDGHQDATADEIDAKRAELKDLDYSGVKSFDSKNEYTNPDELARDIAKAFESTIDKSLIDNFWNSVRTATSATLDTWEAGNQISAEQKKKYLEQYRFFVPLRGWRHGAAKELIYTRGEGFSKSLQKAEGRKSLADNPLAYILSVQFQAIAEQVDNEVKTSMYNLILKNLKNPEINELATIKKLYYVKIKHSDGTEEWEPTEQRPDQELFASGDAKTKIYREHERLRKFRHAKEHEVIVHKPGGDMIIVFKKNQLSTAHALNKQNYIYRTVFGNIYDARDVNKALTLLGSMNNTLKALYTSWNVVFPFTNFMRDFQEASITQSIKQGTGLKVMANYKGAFPAVFRNLIGKPNLNSQMDRDLQDFYSLGGATGYTHTKTIEDIEKDVNREVERLVGKGTVLGSMKNGFHGTMGAVEAWNKVFEDATRFSVYLSSLAAGNSKQDAAMDAKEASVNFNRKGKGSKAWDSWFAFFNVALQSLQKNFKLAKDHTGKFTAVAGSFVMLGFLEALMNALTDDDDKDSAYYNINPWMRQNYLIIPNLPKILTTGEKGNKYLSIPLPQFWRGFKSIGAIAFDIATKKMTIGDGVMAALGNFGSGLLPVDIGGFYKSGEFSWAPVFPTVLKPIVEVAENKNYMGYAIKNEPFTREQKKDLANAGLGKTNVNPAAKYLTDMLFRWGGGKGKYKYYYDQEKGERRNVPGVLDINPSAIEHLFKGYAGGTGAGLSDLFTTVIQATSPDQDIDFKNVPFVNRFIRTVPEAKWNIISEYYNLRDDERANSKLEKEAVKNAETSGDWSTVTAMYGNEYLQRYQETFASFEIELDDAMKMKDFDIVEGNRLSVEIMERAIAEIKELKREYGKK